jgi:hypothetical protein
MQADDLMTFGVISIHPDAPIEEAARLMLHHRISGLPVSTTTAAGRHGDRATLPRQDGAAGYDGSRRTRGRRSTSGAMGRGLRSRNGCKPRNCLRRPGCVRRKEPGRPHGRRGARIRPHIGSALVKPQDRADTAMILC